MSPHSSKKSSPTGKQRLLNFLRGLLEDNSNCDLIMWTNKASSEFRMIKPHKVAELWGAATGNSSMNYDKMSRGLRYFYTNKTLEKVPGKDSRYRFLDATPIPSFIDFSNFEWKNLPDVPTKEEVEVKTANPPQFTIDSLLSVEIKTNASLQSSPSSASTSSAEPSSPTSSMPQGNASLPLLNPLQLLSLIQFNNFMEQHPYLKAFPLPAQHQFFQLMQRQSATNIFQTMLSTQN